MTARFGRRINSKGVTSDSCQGTSQSVSRFNLVSTMLHASRWPFETREKR